MAEFDLSQPQSRMEKILGTIIKTYNGTLDEPQSRVEAYLNEVAEVVATKDDLDTNKRNYFIEQIIKKYKDSNKKDINLVTELLKLLYDQGYNCSKLDNI